MTSTTIERPGYKVGPETLASNPAWLYLFNRSLKVRPPGVAEAEAYALRHHDERWADLYVQYPQAAPAEAVQEDGAEPAPAGPLPYIPGVAEAIVAEHERLRNAKWPAAAPDGSYRIAQAAEAAQETAGDQDAETGPAEDPAAAEDAPEAVAEAAGGENT